MKKHEGKKNSPTRARTVTTEVNSDGGELEMVVVAVVAVEEEVTVLAVEEEGEIDLSLRHLERISFVSVRA